MTNDLLALLDEAAPLQPKKTRWESVGFLRNPFPSRAQPIWDVFHNQEHVRGRFYEDLKVFLRDESNTTMFFTGGNRVGKTHFMEHHRRVLEAQLPDRGVVLPIAVASAESTHFPTFAQHVIEQLADSVEAQTGSSIFEQPTRSCAAKLPPGDFRRALARLESADGEERAERARVVWQWLRGDRIRIGARKQIDVASWLEGSASFVSALGAFVQYWRCTAEPSGTRRPGILIFVDEFELVRRARRDRRDQYLQSLRALIDACPAGLFLAVGMATGLGYSTDELERDYPALFARMRGAREIPALVQVGGVVEAIGYARRFEEFGREQFRLHRGGEEIGTRFLGDREIEGIHRSVSGGRPVPQGDFFDALHSYAEEELSKRVPRS